MRHMRKQKQLTCLEVEDQNGHVGIDICMPGITEEQVLINSGHLNATKTVKHLSKNKKVIHVVLPKI